MQKDRWKEITRIFHAALDLPPEQRPGFVCTAASGDPDLQVEVERLLLADQQADSYLESPLIPAGAFSAALSDEPQLRPGDVLCQRFHILRTVGSGGMGQVFEAHDSELAVNVALKLIRPEIAANPQALARFRQEVRLARRITHPNVCRTFDLDRDTLTTPEGSPRTLVFLTMEFLAGETLAARLKRSGRLIPEEILSISRQIAAALEAAHAIGIVHRDIKPGNIMLVPAGENSRQPARVVITDFGLARLDPVFSQDENSITQHSSHSAHPIGTLAYMAPEQMDGSPISAATDIYAFGLLLFEMATGQRAFPSSNLLSGIAQRLSGPSPSPTTLQPALPDSLEQAVQGCLRLNPEERFQSAQAVLECLTGQSQPLPTPATPASRPQPSPGRQINWTTRNTLLSAAAILLLAVSLFLLGLRYHWWEGNAKLDPGALVYLAPVTNQTGEKSLDNITELLQASLEQSAHINLLDQGRVGDLMERMTIPPDTPITQKFGREIALRANAARVIFAQVAGSQGHYTLNIDIQRTDYTPARFRSHWTQSFPWQVTSNTNAGTIPQELTSTLREASDWVRNKVGESRNDIGRTDIPPEDATTANWEALTEYATAEKMQGRQDTSSAIQALQNAVRLDPGFSVAWARLGDLLVSMGRYHEGYLAYGSALNLGADTRLPRRQRDRIRGEYAMDSGDFEAAEGAYRDYTVYYENDYRGWFLRGYPLLMLGRRDEAITTLEKAYSLDRSKGNAPVELTRTYIAEGNLEEALRWSGILRRLGHLGITNYLECTIHCLKGEFAEATASIAALRHSVSALDRSRSFTLAARLAAERGYPDEALKALSDGIKEDNSQGNAAMVADGYLARAYVESDLGIYNECLADLNSSLNLDASPQRLINMSTVLGRSLAKAPGTYRAAFKRGLISLQSKLPEADFGIVTQIAKARVNGEILLAQGKVGDALAQFRSASHLETSVSGREYLGRALEIAAEQERDDSASKAFRQQAREAYGRLALNHGNAWIFTFDDLPGLYSDQLGAYLRLSSQLSYRDSTVQTLMQEFASLRGKDALTTLASR